MIYGRSLFHSEYLSRRAGPLAVPPPSFPPPSWPNAQGKASPPRSSRTPQSPRVRAPVNFLRCSRIDRGVGAAPVVASLIIFHLSGATKKGTEKQTTSETQKSVQCGTWTKHAEGGIFTSPNYPSKYPPDRECIYIIEAAPRQCIELYFDEKYSIEPSWECKFDHIKKSRYESKAEVPVAMVFADLLLLEIRVFF